VQRVCPRLENAPKTTATNNSTIVFGRRLITWIRWWRTLQADLATKVENFLRPTPQRLFRAPQPFRKIIGATTHFIKVARLWVVSGNNHQTEWQPSHCNGVWLRDCKRHPPVEWRQLHLQARPLYRQLQPQHTRIHPKSQVDNAPEDLKGAKGTNATIKNQPIIPLEYIYICIIYIPNIHNCVSEYEWITTPLMAGAPKPENLKTTTQGTPRRERPNSVYGGSPNTLQQWWCIYERPSVWSYVCESRVSSKGCSA